ncbi:MAG TPA: MFS transporter, partial [Pirellulales bacterium]|nr:MFS transporter [Pirellulales bacterium]
MASPLTQSAGTAAGSRELEASAHERTFGTAFWLTYAANTAMTAASSLFFRYDDFVEALGGGELLLGWLIGVGMVGSLLVRTVQGRGIDDYGARRIWIWSTVLFVVSCLAHLLVSTVYGPLIFVCRTLLQTSMAGFFGASISYIAGRKSTTHMADAIGTLGTSGFIGIVLGTWIGDLVLGDGEHYELMFVAAAALGSSAIVFGWLAPNGELRPIRRRRLPLVWIVRRYHPGPIIWMGVAAGFGLGLPTVFLRPYTRELGIEELGTFFYPYMLVAFVTRLGIRRLPALIGIRWMVLIGISTMVVATGLFVVVRSAWQLCLPAVFLGVAHACIFPAVMAGGTGEFPHRYRGVGTTAMLAMFDLGNFVGQPSFGAVWDAASHWKLPGFIVAFSVSAAAIGLGAVGYAWATRG